MEVTTFCESASYCHSAIVISFGNKTYRMMASRAFIGSVGTIL